MEKSLPHLSFILYAVIEISSDTTIADALKILSENNIMSAPVRKAVESCSIDWRGRYLGIIDYSAIVLWVLENAELAGVVLSAGSVAAAGVGAGALGAIGVGAVALGAAPVAAAGLAIAAVGAAVVGGLAADRETKKDAPSVADQLGEEFYTVLMQKEPFKSTKVRTSKFCSLLSITFFVMHIQTCLIYNNYHASELELTIIL